MCSYHGRPRSLGGGRSRAAARPPCWLDRLSHRSGNQGMIEEQGRSEVNCVMDLLHTCVKLQGQPEVLPDTTMMSEVNRRAETPGKQLESALRRRLRVPDLLLSPISSPSVRAPCRRVRAAEGAEGAE